MIFTCARILQLSVRDRIGSMNAREIVYQLSQTESYSLQLQIWKLPQVFLRNTIRFCTYPLSHDRITTTSKETTNNDVAPTTEMVKSTLTVTFDSEVLLWYGISKD